MQFGPGLFDGVGSSSSDGVHGAAGFDLALGASLGRSLVVYGEVFAFDNIGFMQAHYAATGVGPGIAVWLPHQAFIGVSAMRLWMSESNWIPNSSGSSKREWDAIGKGFGASAVIGREWRTRRSANLTSGLALHGFIGRLRCASGCTELDDMRPSAWTTRGAMLAASFTFN